MTTPDIRDAGIRQWLVGLSAAQILQLARDYARTGADLTDLIKMTRAERHDFLVDAFRRALKGEDVPPLTTWNVV